MADQTSVIEFSSVPDLKPSVSLIVVFGDTVDEGCFFVALLADDRQLEGVCVLVLGHLLPVFHCLHQLLIVN